MNQQKSFQAGEKVKGLYYGQAYTGTVDYTRPNLLNPSRIHYIVLDAPINEFGTDRDRIIISTGNSKSDYLNTIEAA